MEDGKRALQGKKTYDTWLEGIAQIFEAVLENKPFIMNVYHAVAHEKVEQYLYKLTYELIVNVVEENQYGSNERNFLTSKMERKWQKPLTAK